MKMKVKTEVLDESVTEHERQHKKKKNAETQKLLFCMEYWIFLYNAMSYRESNVCIDV